MISALLKILARQNSSRQYSILASHTHLLSAMIGPLLCNFWSLETSSPALGVSAGDERNMGFVRRRLLCEGGSALFW